MQIVNDLGTFGTPVMGSSVDFALNSIFENAFRQLGGVGQAGNSTAPSFNIGNPFSFNMSSPSFNFNFPGNFSFNFPSFNFPSSGSNSWNTGGSDNSGPVEFPSFMTQRNIDKIKTLEPEMQKAIVELIRRGHERGINGIEVDSPRRTKERQAQLKKEADARGRSKYVAKNSQHVIGLAVDLNIVKGKYLKPEEYAELGRIWRDDMGFTYGIDIPDAPERWHFDLRPDGRKFGWRNPTRKGWETTWLGKGGQSAVASNGSSNSGGGWSNPWSGGFNFSMPTSFSSGFNWSFPTSGFNFGSFNWGNWNFNNSGMNRSGGSQTKSLKSAYSADIERIVGQYGQYGNDAKFMSCLIEHESGFGPNKVSSAGAVGLGQMMPKNWSHYGITNPRDPEQNIKGCTLMMNDLLKHYNGDKKLALVAYRSGQGYVDGQIRQYGNSFEAIAPHLTVGARGYATSISQRYETAPVYA